MTSHGPSADAEDEVLMLNVRNPRTDVLQLRVWDADTISKERLTKCSTFVERVPEAWQDDDIGHVAHTSVTSVTAVLHRFAVLILIVCVLTLPAFRRFLCASSCAGAVAVTVKKQLQQKLCVLKICTLAYLGLVFGSLLQLSINYSMSILIDTVLPCVSLDNVGSPCCRHAKTSNDIYTVYTQ